jgi:sugar (pentulose or hexulose) kinase
MDVFIGLDVGTSKLSAVALDGEGQPLASAARPNDAGVAGLPPGRDEQSPARIHDAALQVLANLSRALGREARRARAIGLTGQMHGVLLAGPGLRPLSNLITWRDRRADERSPAGRTYLEELIDAAGAGAFACTGSRPAAGCGIATLYHMGREGGPARGSRHALLVHDWLAAALGRPALPCGRCRDGTAAAGARGAGLLR